MLETSAVWWQSWEAVPALPRRLTWFGKSRPDTSYQQSTWGRYWERYHYLLIKWKLLSASETRSRRPIILLWTLLAVILIHGFIAPFATIQLSRSAHSWVQAIRLTFKPGTTKTGIEILGDLNGLIQVAVNFSLLPRYTEIDETRHVVPSRSSGFPVMRLVAPLSRIRLSLRSWSMILMIWAHAFHGSTEEFSQWWKSHTLIVCLPF